MLSLAIQNLGDVTVFRFTGRITAGSDTGIYSAVAANSGPGMVVLDLAAVSGIDAAGLGALVNLRAWANGSNRQLKLMNVTPRVGELLQLTGLSRLFDVCSVREMLDLICRAAHASLVMGREGSLQFRQIAAAA